MGIVASAITEFYVNEYARLKRIVSRILVRPDAADDVIQDTFLKLSDHDLKISDRGLLVRAAQNVARDYNRLEKTRTSLFDKVHDSQIIGEPVSPEKSLMMSDQLQSLFRAIHSMPHRRAQIFLLAKLDEMPYARIAEELGVSLSTVEKEMAAAMAFCHKWQQEHDFP
ncbi:sigma-70 family RNA polymerase sigma factor [Rhizobiaceae bacterium BDR2-2]|uniref:Sigma-70 family RNA polymerase sigma factor n=1 Tax=Ectorhizobium quercum TaxID=2965071 RepID=A0AAE3N2C6_9HYPH|nr:sigma-70 family RNA polymerase sigma factor [Ectorhizobium quercum]MCX8999738.1 sigma-70 family RNA polymerase sigma factor [Ectorhizobium quercum]